METLLLIGGVIVLSAAIAATFRHPATGAVYSFVGIMALYHSGYCSIPPQTLVFWAVAVLIVLLIKQLKPNYATEISNTLRNYTTGGALAGMMAGVTLGSSAMIVGSVAGVLLGGLACHRLSRSSEKMQLRPIVEFGLPAVVSVSIAGLAITGFMAR